MAHHCTHVLDLTCHHVICAQCASSLEEQISPRTEENRLGNTLVHCPECGVGVVNYASRRKQKGKSAKNLEEIHDQTANDEDSEKNIRAVLFDNLKKLEEKNREVDSFLARLSGIKSRVKQNASYLKLHINKECDLLVSLIEKRKRILTTQVGKQEKEKLKELESQLLSSQRVLQKGVSLYIRSDNQINQTHYASSGAFDKVAHNLNESIENTLKLLTPPEGKTEESFQNLILPNFETVSEEINALQIEKEESTSSRASKEPVKEDNDKTETKSNGSNEKPITPESPEK